MLDVKENREDFALNENYYVTVNKRSESPVCKGVDASAEIAAFLSASNISEFLDEDPEISVLINGHSDDTQMANRYLYGPPMENGYADGPPMTHEFSDGLLMTNETSGGPPKTNGHEESSANIDHEMSSLSNDHADIPELTNGYSTVNVDMFSSESPDIFDGMDSPKDTEMPVECFNKKESEPKVKRKKKTKGVLYYNKFDWWAPEEPMSWDGVGED